MPEGIPRGARVPGCRGAGVRRETQQIARADARGSENDAQDAARVVDELETVARAAGHEVLGERTYLTMTLPAASVLNTASPRRENREPTVTNARYFPLARSGTGSRSTLIPAGDFPYLILSRLA